MYLHFYIFIHLSVYRYIYMFIAKFKKMNRFLKVYNMIDIFSWICL